MTIQNDNLYKYQIENLEELDKIPKRLEERTNEKYLIEIGSAVWTYHSYGWNTMEGNFYLAVNYYKVFIIIDDLTGKKESFTLTQILNSDVKISFDKNIYQNINKCIDKILKDNEEREQYHSKLNNQLKAILNSI